MANTHITKPEFKRRAFRPGYLCTGMAPKTQRIMEKQKIEVCPCVTLQRLGCSRNLSGNREMLAIQWLQNTNAGETKQ